MRVRGRASKFGDNIDTDMIVPARYLSTGDPDQLKVHFMEDVDPKIAGRVKPGEIIVAGSNYGCGSSREHAPIAIKGLGISCVIAESFARIFYRNSFNIGLPIIECQEASKGIKEGDEIQVDFDTGSITNITKNEVYKGQAYPEFIQGIISAGGLVNYVRQGGK